MICLGDELSDTGALKLLEVLLSDEMEADDKKKIISEEFQIQMTQNLDEEVENMCNLSQGVEARGARKTTAAAIQNLMKSTHMTSEQAMSVLSVPENEYKQYEEIIKNKLQS